MKTLTTYKASPVTSSEPVEGVVISISEELPKFLPEGTLQEHMEMFHGEARKLADALRDNLPQGIRYRLAVELMGDITKSMGYIGTGERD